MVVDWVSAKEQEDRSNSAGEKRVASETDRTDVNRCAPFQGQNDYEFEHEEGQRCKA